MMGRGFGNQSHSSSSITNVSSFSFLLLSPFFFNDYLVMRLTDSLSLSLSLYIYIYWIGLDWICGQQKKQHRGWLSGGGSFKPENLIPGIVIGFIFGLLSSKLNPIINNNTRTKRRSILSSNTHHHDDDLKMVLVVRQDLKMGQGKIASQCAHAATGLYSELMQSDQNLLRRWEHCGQAKIVVTCKNQQEMNKLQETAEGIGLPTYVVADAGRTQVSAGSKTVLAIGPGYKSIVDSVTGKQRLL